MSIADTKNIDKNSEEFFRIRNLGKLKYISGQQCISYYAHQVSRCLFEPCQFWIALGRALCIGVASSPKDPIFPLQVVDSHLS
jgi:hypothetical protein